MRTTEPRYTHVIFDLDGTILNTLEDLADSVNHVCAAHGWPTHDYEAYRYFVGNGMAKLVERATPAAAHVEPLRSAVQQEFVAYYALHSADKTCPYPGMPELLETLKAEGVTIAVLTNKHNSAAQEVMQRYYPGVFHAVQGAVEGYATKPDPALLHRLMDELGAVPQTTLFVGDSNVDIRTAKNGGIAGCGVLWGFRTRQELEEEGATLIAEDPEELLHIILGK